MAREEIDIIKKAVSVLDSADYARYSEERAKTYLNYASGSWKDERRLIAPIVFPKFLEQILGFKLGENIGTQEKVPEGRDIPDYIPADTRTHPFVFDCKGMDTRDLSKWYSQIRRYIEEQGVRYGILTNMRDLDVYTLESEQEIEAFNFSFAELYKDYNEDLAGVLEKENTKDFLKFVERFRYIPLTIHEKFKNIAEAKPWTGKETLNIDLLTGRLRHIVECIHEDATANKDALVLLKEADLDRAKAIAQEIELIASEIERGREIKEASVETFEEIINAPPKSLLGKALNIFFYRVAYFTMTRLLLARTWEDIGFIDQSLYDGGLAKWYENFNKEISRVLKYAFGVAAERYKWLFNIDNNYTWYEPSDDTLIDVLYELSNFNLGKLNQDVLGTIYEEYIDKVDKRKKGQYYTPREIIELIWNRVGFTNPKAFFWHIEGKRRPRFIFDPATGSGGFLVEAARRIREESGINYNDFQDLNDVRFAMVSYIFGSEISIFPYYITEVNMLIQLTPVVKRMIELKKGFRESYPLGVVPTDALSLYNPEPSLLSEKEYEFDNIRELLPLERQKKAVFQNIKKKFDGQFSYCCANPPYIGEKGNKELFRSSLQRFPYWQEFYQGKMDYLYFFIILGLSKLRNPGVRTPGGKLGFITTAYWPTADGALKLRKYILRNAKIKEMIFFEDVKIFEYARGQHNMVFVLEKCAGQERSNERSENRIKIVRVLAKHQVLPGESIREKLKFLTQHIQQYIKKSKWQDQYIKLFWSGVKQGELPNDGKPWLLGEETIVLKTDRNFVSFESMCRAIFQGVDPKANKVTNENIKFLPSYKIEEHGIQIGDGIFVLKKDEIKNSWPNHVKELIKPLYKNSDIGPYVVDIDSVEEYLLYVYENSHLYPEVSSHLSKFEEILLNRPENSSLFIARPRNPDLIESDKIVVSRWGAKTRNFAYQTKNFYELSDVNIFVLETNITEDILYVLGLLNSSLLQNWIQQGIAKQGAIQLSLLKQIPIRRINSDDNKETQLHDNISKNVKFIMSKMNILANYSKYFRGTRLTRIKPQDPFPDINPESIVQALLPEKRFSLRTYPDVKVTYGQDFEETKFILHKVGKVDLTLYGPELKLIGKNRKVIMIGGSDGLLQIVALILEDHKNESWISIKELPLIPETARDYEDKKQEIIGKVVKLRTEIQKLQSSIDTIVLDLYGVSEDFGNTNNKTIDSQQTHDHMVKK